MMGTVGTEGRAPSHHHHHHHRPRRHRLIRSDDVLNMQSHLLAWIFC